MAVPLTHLLPLSILLSLGVDSDPGGVFSSGDLFVADVGAGPGTQDASHSHHAQLRLVPYLQPANATFPEKGMVGDFFCAFVGDSLVATLFICLHINFVTHKPEWFRVVCTGGTDGGQPIT